MRRLCEVDMSDDTKALLMKGLGTVPAIKNEHGELLASLDRRMSAMEQRQDWMDQHLNTGEAEQKQIRVMIGSQMVKEVARLDGRTDQLAQDTALGRRIA